MCKKKGERASKCNPPCLLAGRLGEGGIKGGLV